MTRAEKQSLIEVVREEMIYALTISENSTGKDQRDFLDRASKYAQIMAALIADF